MAKVKVADFDLENLNSLYDVTQRVKSSIDELKEANKTLVKQGDSSSQAFIQNQAELKKLNTEYRANLSVITQSDNAIKKQTDRTKLLNIALNQEVKSINDARSSNKILNKLRNETNTTTAKGRKELEQLNARLDQNNKFIKENVDQYTKQKINVGNYTSSIKDALAQSTLFGRAQRVLTQTLGILGPVITSIKTNLAGAAASFRGAAAASIGFGTAQKASAVATGILNGALKLLKVALIATGIGAILVLLGSLIAFFTKTQRGADFVSKAMAALGVAFDVIVDRVSQFGEALVQFFSGDFEGGFDSMKKSLSGIGDEIAREVGLAYDLEAAFQSLRDREIALISVQAQRKKQIEELRFAAKDELTELAQRAALLEEAGKIEEQILADNIALKKEDARISSERLALGESSRDDIRADAELQAEVIDLETQSLKLRRTIEAEKQSLLKRARAEQESAIKQQIADSQKILDLALKESKTKIDIFVQENKEIAKSVQEKLAFAEELKDKRLLLLQEEIEAGKKTQTEAELERLKIKKEFLDEQKELVVEFADEELRIFILKNQTRLDENQLLNDQLVEQEKARLDAIAEQERVYLDAKLEQGKISQLEYNEAINEIDTENRFNKADLDLELEEQKKQKQAEDLQLQREIDEANLGLDFELQKKYLEAERQAALEQAKQTGANVNLINQLYDQKLVEQKREVAQTKLDIAANVFGGLVDLLGKETAAGKAAAVAQSVVNVAQGVTKALAQGGLLGIVTGALVAAAGAISIAKILGTPKPDLPSKVNAPKAESGMRVGSGRKLTGPRHSQGGIPIEAEGGEWILNRKASQMFSPILSVMNDIGRGRSGINSSGIFADGGIASRSITSRSGPSLEDIRVLIQDSQQTIKVVNVATETQAVLIDRAIIAENASI